MYIRNVKSEERKGVLQKRVSEYKSINYVETNVSTN